MQILDTNTGEICQKEENGMEDKKEERVESRIQEIKLWIISAF